MKKLMIAAAFALLTLPAMAEKVVVTVSNMHCQNCANRVEATLRDNPSVNDVQIDLATKQVTVDFDKKKLSAQKVKKLLTDANFQLGSSKDGKSCGKCEKKGGCGKASEKPDGHCGEK